MKTSINKIWDLFKDDWCRELQLESSLYHINNLWIEDKGVQWTITSNSIRSFSPSSFHCIFILTEQRLLILILQFAKFLKSNSKTLMNILKLHCT